MSAAELQTISLHGHELTYRRAGRGPVIVLIHGIAGSSQTWTEAIPWLARDHTVIAPDLLGHGQSAKPRGDYSLGAYASGIRDLLVALGHDRATFVGHSLGGGVAMQLAYQFPQHLDRLVLVSSGGLGREVHLLLRSATLPGAEYVLPLLCSEPLRGAGEAVGRFLRRIGLSAAPDVEEFARGFASLADVDARQAFIRTARSIIDAGGQHVSATDRLYLAADVPTLIVWGERDPMIPFAHAVRAHELLPGSRLEPFPAGHFPHLEHPRRFGEVLAEFVATTPAADLRPDQIRRLLLDGSGSEAEPARARARDDHARRAAADA